MTIEYSYWTGPISDVEARLKISVAAYLKLDFKVKIGITNDPERRANEHSQDLKWDNMVVIYKSLSVNNINDMERILIDHHWVDIENEIAGGGGPNASQGPYYLYLLLG